MIAYQNLTSRQRDIQTNLTSLNKINPPKRNNLKFLWNNRNILIRGKSVFFQKFAVARILYLAQIHRDDDQIAGQKRNRVTGVTEQETDKADRKMDSRNTIATKNIKQSRWEASYPLYMIWETNKEKKRKSEMVEKNRSVGPVEQIIVFLA